jgi:hypothetical protein
MRCQLFTGWRLRTAFSTGAALTAVRPALTTTRAATGPALASRRPHLLQLLHLRGRQDFLKLCLHFGLQGRHLLLLVGGQLQLLLCAWRQQVKPAALAARPAALSARTTGAAGGASAWRRTLPVRLLIGILRCDEARRCAERQCKEDDFDFHNIFYVFHGANLPEATLRGH